MTFRQIGLTQFWMMAVFTIPCLMLSLLAALMTFGLLLVVQVPLWWGIFTLMQQQRDATEDSPPSLWWWSLLYHVGGLVFWLLYVRGGHDLSILPIDMSRETERALIFFVPVLGTLLSLLALAKVAWSGRAAQRV